MFLRWMLPEHTMHQHHSTPGPRLVTPYQSGRRRGSERWRANRGLDIQSGFFSVYFFGRRGRTPGRGRLPCRGLGRTHCSRALFQVSQVRHFLEAGKDTDEPHCPVLLAPNSGSWAPAPLGPHPGLNLQSTHRHREVTKSNSPGRWREPSWQAAGAQLGTGLRGVARAGCGGQRVPGLDLTCARGSRHWGAPQTHGSRMPGVQWVLVSILHPGPVGEQGPHRVPP